MAVMPDKLSNFFPFSTLSPELVKKAAEKSNIVAVEKGSLLFKRGKVLPERLYLLSGSVDLINSSFERHFLVADEADAAMPINMQEPTQVSAVAKTAVTYLSIPADYLNALLAMVDDADSSEAFVDDRDWMSHFLQQPLFTRLPPANIQQLFSRLHSRAVAKGDVVVKLDDVGDYFYVLEAGDANVIGRSGEIIAQLIPGDYFGEEALVGDARRNASVVMQTSGRIKTLSKEDFKALLEEPVLQYVELNDFIASPKKYYIVDVRLAVERRFGVVPLSKNIPLHMVRRTLTELSAEAIYLITDDAGARAKVAAQLFAQAGLEVKILLNAETLYQPKLSQSDA